MTYFGMVWYPEFYGLSWMNPPGQLIIGPVFEDENEAKKMAENIESWKENFTRITFIERSNGEYSFVCYQDPKISSSKANLGMYRSSMEQSATYSKVKPMFDERDIFVQIVYATNPKDPSTYKMISSPVKISRLRVITEEDLKSQEYALEKTAHETSGGYKIDT